MHWIVIYPVDNDVYLSNYMAYVYSLFVSSFSTND